MRILFQSGWWVRALAAAWCPAFRLFPPREARDRQPKGWTPAQLALLLICLAVTGCTTLHETQSHSLRPFHFDTDTFAYPNDLVWEYHFDPQTGKGFVTLQQPPPTYSHRCVVVARSALQFFAHARFDPSLPVADDPTYRRLIRNVISRSPQRESAAARKVVVPGYANLREFSVAQEAALKKECGAAWQSYLQRGNWRLTLPFSERHQLRQARQLTDSLRHRPAVLHLVRFPSLSINHAVLAYDVAEETDEEIRFSVYDPNEPGSPALLIFQKATRRFYFPANRYFAGGRVDVYEIYKGWCY